MISQENYAGTETIILVHFNNQPIGAIQELQLRQYLYTEHGEHNELTIWRMRLDKSRIAEVFYNSVLDVETQINCFDITITTDKVIIGEIKNIWLSKIDPYYITDDWYIINQCEAEAEFALIPAEVK